MALQPAILRFILKTRNIIVKMLDNLQLVLMQDSLALEIKIERVDLEILIIFAMEIHQDMHEVVILIEMLSFLEFLQPPFHTFQLDKVGRLQDHAEMTMIEIRDTSAGMQVLLMPRVQP